MKDHIKAILKSLSFVKFSWDGDEVTLFSASGEPFGESEFTAGSPTSHAFDELYEIVEDKPAFELILDK